jgi:hypothetical protein
LGRLFLDDKRLQSAEREHIHPHVRGFPALLGGDPASLMITVASRGLGKLDILPFKKLKDFPGGILPDE